MRCFVTIDRQPDSDVVGIWVSARVGSSSIESTLNGEDGARSSGGGTRPLNVNAVVTHLANDPQALTKVHSMTREAVVIKTPGSVLDGLPIDGDPLGVADFDALLDETEAHQRAIVAALDVYATRISERTGRVLKPKDIVRPTWLPRPDADQYQPHEDSVPARALATANFVCAAWRFWLATDEERRLRASSSGKIPSRMIPELRHPLVADLPPDFASSLYTQPRV